ncbi:hypothetical protein HYU17_00665 [Candidatus Woesearchaeota archaeon]|nr:hypothetical protein [Candidatus Woesearchaeota archaeon]
MVSGRQYNTSTGQAFTATYVQSEAKLLVEFPSEALVIKNQSCTMGKSLKGCLSEIKFKGYNYSLPDKEVYDVRLTLSLFVPEIEIAKYVEKPTIDVGEETTVYVNITNTGSAAATVHFTENVSSGLKAIEMPGQRCQLSAGNTLVLTTDLTVKEQRQCNYLVSALEPGTYSLKSTAAFAAVTPRETAASAAISVNALPMLMNATYLQNIPLGEKVNLTFTLKSGEKIDALSFAAFIPNPLKITSFGGIAEQEKQPGGSKLKYGNRFTSLNGSIDLPFTSEAVSVGEFYINADASWLLGELKQKASLAFPVNITLTKPYLRAGRYDNQTGLLDVDIVNPSHLPLYNVSVALNSFGNATGKPINVEVISSLSHASFEAALATAGNTSYNGSIRYYTPYRQELTATATLPINASQAIRKEEEPAKPAQPTAEAPHINTQPLPTSSESEPAASEQQNIYEQPQRKSTASSQIKLAAVIAGAIVLLIMAFALIKSRGKGGTGHEGAQEEPTGAESETENTYGPA